MAPRHLPPDLATLSLGYILQRSTQSMPEVERMRMLYGMIDKIRADLVKLTVEDIWPRY